MPDFKGHRGPQMRDNLYSRARCFRHLRGLQGCHHATRIGNRLVFFVLGSQLGICHFKHKSQRIFLLLDPDLWRVADRLQRED